ncbi:MAG: hypothetical protein VX992_07540, partial [Acidobacteriota bacterium]|nr:hypothetical protein [Acidobacteriota bacterium]
ARAGRVEGRQRRHRRERVLPLVERRRRRHRGRLHAREPVPLPGAEGLRGQGVQGAHEPRDERQVPARRLEARQRGRHRRRLHRVLRGGAARAAHQETLLTLLEAFVYDPLVDWAAERTLDEQRRGAELSVGISLCASRVGELVGFWGDQRAACVMRWEYDLAERPECLLTRFFRSKGLAEADSCGWLLFSKYFS